MVEAERETTHATVATTKATVSHPAFRSLNRTITSRGPAATSASSRSPTTVTKLPIRFNVTNRRGDIPVDPAKTQTSAPGKSSTVIPATRRNSLSTT